MSKISEKIWRTITFKISDINDEERTFTAVASDDSTDRHGENIRQDGWDLDNFIKNPVVPWGHDYYNPPIAKAIEIGLKDGKLMFKPKFATVEELSSDPANPSEWAKFVDTIFKMYKGGYLRAFSVGFIPKEMEGDTFIKQELLEISAVTVPSNPNALALAYKEGIIDDSERKLLIKTYEAQIKNLTDLGKMKNNNEQEFEMEEVKQLIADAVTELKEAHAAEIAELKSELETKLSDTVTELEAKFVAKEVDPENNDDPEDPDNPDDKSGNSDEEAGDDDDNREVDGEEAEKMLKQFTDEAIEKQLGKVD